MAESADKFIHHAGLISLLTLLSRLLGVVRDAACAAVFGAGLVWDAFSFAFRIPNLFRRLFGEGALSAAFVPFLSEYLELHTPEEAWRFAGRVAGALAMVLVAILLLAELALVGVIGFGQLSARWHMALLLTALLLPYMLLICLTALAGAVLNSLKHFAAPALAPVVLNVCWIAAVLLVSPAVASTQQQQIIVLAGAILVAGALQLALQLFALHRKGFRWRVCCDVLHPQVRRLAAAMAPVALGLGALQLNVLLDGVIAISLAAPKGKATFLLLGWELPYPMEIGANSVLYYGNRLMQFPLGVFGIALATAVFPVLSRQAARKDWPRFARSVVRGVGAGLFIAVPASVGLVLLRYPLIELIFQRGAFTPRMTARTARVLAAYCAGIWAFGALHLLTRAFYSMGKHGTPARTAAAMVLLNIALNLLLVWPLGEAGLATATSVTACVQVLVLAVLLGRKVSLRGMRALVWDMGAVLTATAGMSIAVLALLALLPTGDALAVRLLRAVAPAAFGAAVYLGLAALLDCGILRSLAAAFRPAPRDCM